MKGDATLCVDLSKAKIADKSEDTKQATIILPEPQVLDLASTMNGPAPGR